MPRMRRTANARLGRWVAQRERIDVLAHKHDAHGSHHHDRTDWGREMSQDLRRERAGAKFETIAGATNYIAELEQENRELKYLREDDKSEIVELLVELENRSRRIAQLEAHNRKMRGALGAILDLIAEREESPWRGVTFGGTPMSVSVGAEEIRDILSRHDVVFEKSERESDPITDAFRMIQDMCDGWEAESKVNQEWINTVRIARGADPIDFESINRRVEGSDE